MTFGNWLKARREKLDPVALGYSPKRRRTPGLRREEVAQRADISATWYTWLEQGRGGAPSAQVLERLADALLLTDVEKEYAFVLALGRTPDVHYQPSAGITPRLQRVLDAFPYSPAMIRTPTWDIVAWNRAATVVMADYGQLPPRERNILRLMFLHRSVRERQEDWESVARQVVAVFRADAARAGAAAEMHALAAELCQASPEFAGMWSEHDVRTAGEGVKRMRDLTLEYSTFIVDGRPDLAMMVYNPARPEDAERIQALLYCGSP